MIGKTPEPLYLHPNFLRALNDEKLWDQLRALYQRRYQELSATVLSLAQIRFLLTIYPNITIHELLQPPTLPGKK